MKRYPIISFFIGLIISGVILGVVYLGVFLLTFNLAGGETLQEIENQRTTLLIIAIILEALAIIKARQFLKRGKKFVAYGISILPIVSLVFFTIHFSDNFPHHTALDKTIWEQDKWKSFDMAATLIKENKLAGLNRNEVKEMLGPGVEEYGNANSDRGTILYLVNEDWRLIVYFQNDSVVDTKLRKPWLDI